MSINFPNDPATNPGNGGSWTDPDGNVWVVEIVAGEAIWTMQDPVLNIDDLGDVDTSTVAPTDGQVLVWDGANTQWEPGSVATSTTNFADLGDYELREAAGATSVLRTVATGSSNNAGSTYVGTSIITSGYTYWSYGPEGKDTGTVLDYLLNTASFPIDVVIDGTTVTLQEAVDQSGTTLRLQHTGYTTQLTNNALIQLSLANAATTPVADGDVLQYSATDSAWQPGPLALSTEPVIEWTLTANGSTDYIFSGAGFAGTETDPVIYVVRGQTYKFTNGMGAHPFQIQSTQGTSGTAYNDGITNNAVSNGTLTWEVRMDAPSTLYYQCTSHADMNGTIYVLDEGSAVTSIDDLSDVDTTTVAPTDGQALVWDNTAQKWEPGTVSGGGGGGTSLPSGSSDGEALIWENGAWAVGPVIGGVDYTPSNADSSFGNVELLLLGNGTNGSTTFTDSSSIARTATVTGNTQISTTEYKFGGASIYFDGTGDYLEFASDNDLIDWDRDNAFTVEAWVYASSWSDWSVGVDNLPALCGNMDGSGVYNYWSFGPNNNGNVVFQYYSNSTVLVTGSTTLSTGTWHHIAMSYDGTTIRIFVNGALDASDTVSGTPTTSTSYNFTVGSYNNISITGYVDDLRVTQGTARYTTTFTPPSAELPTASGTSVTIPYSIDKLDDVDTSTVAPTDGQALVWDNTAQKWEPGTVSGGGIARSEVSGTTASIADAASADLTITSTGKAGQLLSIETDAAAWVTVYVSQATRTADAGRAETTDPNPGSGVLAEAITTGAQTVLITPSTMFFNNEATPASELYLKVVNKSGATAAITVTLKVIPSEV